MDRECLFTTPNPPTERLTEAQRARISHNFRAAKALLARKRPREIASLSGQFPLRNGSVNGRENRAQDSGNKTPVAEALINTSCTESKFKSKENGNAMETLDHITSIQRVALAEVSMNTSSPYFINNFRSRDRECCSTTCVGGISMDNNELDISTARKECAHIENEFVSDPFKTPTKPPEGSSFSDSLLIPSVLNDDLDETILQEIDALCEQNFSTKKEMQSPSRTFNTEVQFKDNSSIGDLNNNMGPVSLENIKNEDTVDYEDPSESKAHETATSQIIQSGSMPNEYMKYFQSLNDRQQTAACTDISIPLMIVAGPGSGKTSTMVGRVLMLLNEGISSSNILAMTFTTAAASEMRDRIAAVTGKATAKELTISTFHSFSLQLCRSHAEKLGRTSEFLIYGHGQQRRAIIEAVRLLDNEKSRQSHDACKVEEDSNNIRSPHHFKDKSKKWQKFVSQAKASGKTPEDYRKMGDEIGAAVLWNYNDILRSCNALDYHDLISCSVMLLSDFPDVFKECQDSWKAIVVDEFQDTSAMQYSLLHNLASHNHITVVGDDDQSIFSFNGADISGFDSFRKDFPNCKEVRLNKNYRSTRCIVEAASSLIRNNMKRCQLKDVLTDNSSGSKITIKECQNENAQCAFVVDKILEATSNGSAVKSSYGNIAILYRRQVSGKLFQAAFRDRNIPFNTHGVAFYRKKVVRAIISMLRTTLPGCDDGPYRQAFKALLPIEITEKKRVIEHIDKISTTRKCSFISAAQDIFNAKISGTFKRSQLTQGSKVLFTLDMISRLVHREQSISAVITSVANMVPQKYLLEQRAVIDNDRGHFLNEDNDLRSVHQYLLDDISDFFSTQFVMTEGERDDASRDKGCAGALKAFLDYISERERENFRSRRHENDNSVTLTTIHQSKGLEWDIVFIVKANESEIPLLHEFNSVAKDNGSSVEEERRLLYVAMTRARIKLFILYVTMDSNWQMLQPSRYLKEIPHHLREVQAEISIKDLQTNYQNVPKETSNVTINLPIKNQVSEVEIIQKDFQDDEASIESTEAMEACTGNGFLRRFSMEGRSVVSHLFHQWAKKRAFRDPKRLLDKVRFVIDERLRVKKNKHKDVLHDLKSCLSCDEAFSYAEYVLRWEQIPADQRAHMMQEKQEHFQKLRVENSMGSSTPTSKQLAYLKSLGCTVEPSSRLHACRLIEQYKSL